MSDDADLPRAANELLMDLDSLASVSNWGDESDRAELERTIKSRVRILGSRLTNALGKVKGLEASYVAVTAELTRAGEDNARLHESIRTLSNVAEDRSKVMGELQGVINTQLGIINRQREETEKLVESEKKHRDLIAEQIHLIEGSEITDRERKATIARLQERVAQLIRYRAGGQAPRYADLPADEPPITLPWSQSVLHVRTAGDCSVYVRIGGGLGGATSIISAAEARLYIRALTAAVNEIEAVKADETKKTSYAKAVTKLAEELRSQITFPEPDQKQLNKILDSFMEEVFKL